jgi:putative phage-type endonuclease
MSKKAWLKERQKRLQTSEWASVMGYGYQTRFELWDAKVNGSEQKETYAMRKGSATEDFTAREYELATGRETWDPGDFEIFVHPDIPWLGSTLDRITIGNKDNPSPRDGRGPLELKDVNDYGAGLDWADGLPDKFYLQLQGQMDCFGSTWGSIAGSTRGGLSWADFEIAREYLDTVYKHLEVFWWHVQHKTPPKDDSFKSLPAVKRVYHEGDGTTLIWDDEIADLVDRWESAKIERGEWDRKSKAFESQIRQEMKKASFAALPDGTVLSREIRKRKGYTVEPVEYTVLTRKRPKGV